MSWLETQKLEDIHREKEISPHLVDACAAALAAWGFEDPSKEPSFFIPAESPFHPYDFCCRKQLLCEGCFYFCHFLKGLFSQRLLFFVHAFITHLD
ncbi:hypothetical protein [Metabacillus sp. RGM 3146]|uniref:hypothetical protein n=1 Tax=Metabacillus sp. RGM 3146 TaxID=3401092 RepID=UPI003B9B5D58